MTDVPTLFALVFSGVGAFAAARSLSIQGSEHKRLTAELEKRADFQITLDPGLPDAGADSATYVTNATDVNLQFAIGIRNTGTRAATHVTINFLAPDRQGTLVWAGPDGAADPDKPKAVQTSERLSDAPGLPMTRWLPYEFDRIAIRTPRMVWARLLAEVPPSGSLDLPVRVRVQSDDLPDDVTERVKDYVVHIRHGNP